MPLLSSYRHKRMNYLICRNIWNAKVMYYQCLVSTVQIMTSNYSNPLCYWFLLKNATLDLPSLRKRTSWSHSSLEIFSYWIWWTPLVEQQVLISSWMHTELQKQKDSSLSNGSITLTKCKIQNISRMNFCAGITKKMLFPPWTHCEKWLFSTTK